MAQLAIKGHSTRGKEVIEILEMLGGKIRRDRLAGNEVFSWYYINGNGYIDYKHYSLFYDTTVFILEKFLEYFPYKVGGKVQHKGATSCGSVYEVEKMRWVDDHVEYEVKRLWCWNDHYTFTAEDLQPFEEETMEENLTIQDVRDNNAEWLLNKLKGMSVLDMFSTVNDLYNKLNNQKYPKTYEECCEIIGAQQDRHYFYTIRDKQDYPHEVAIMKSLDNLRQLLICRDAYWRIAGKQMGLGKSWEPDFTISEYKYTIVEIAGIVVKCVNMCNKHILAFPTEEMRDAFYENFKDLIEACKEFL